MARTVAIGVQNYETLIRDDSFYVDKTDFIREWWEERDAVTLITRPRRFGKTLNMSMLNCFFSNQYAGRQDLFEGKKVWEAENMRALQGTYPVIFLTFAGVKGTTFPETFAQIRKLLVNLFSGYPFLYHSDVFTENERKALNRISEEMNRVDTEFAVNLLTSLLEKYYGKKVLIFLDEYDTPLQEAYVHGYWDEMTAFIRTIFNNTFKTNPAMKRAVMTGITRVSKESIFSDLNNLTVVTTTSDRYTSAFGFTEAEVFSALDENGADEEEKKEVKRWYDGFTFGKVPDIYNPWSVTSYLKERRLGCYWANTSSNSLVGKLLREGGADLKIRFEDLMNGGCVETVIDEQIIYNQLDDDPNAVWGLLLASGYLKSAKLPARTAEDQVYTLTLTNLEVKLMFRRMFKDWFRKGHALSYFADSMLKEDIRGMNIFMNEMLQNTVSFFDTGSRPSRREPENFYHGLVLGLLAEKTATHLIKSNRESGYGRYDVVMEPKEDRDPAVIMEFKVFDEEDGEKTLEDTAANALAQIEEKHYDAELLSRGISQKNILRYGMAFEGKKCLIRKGGAVT